MEVKIVDSTNKQVGKKKLPSQFEEKVRPDLIKRAVFAVQSHKRQPYGSSPLAGFRHSVRISKRRRAYRGSYGLGISRTPRKIMARRGTRMTWTGAFVPYAVGGRRAHPPKAEKKWSEKINKKERRKAIRSAVTATMLPELVKNRHNVPKDYPFLISKKLENMDKTKTVLTALKAIGLSEELDRVKLRKVRAGKGKLRGRKYKKKKGPLIVVSKECKLSKAAKNIQGVEVVDVKHINAELLAPGAVPGRLTLWSEAAIDVMEKEGLFN